MFDYSKCSCNRIPLECNHCNHSNHSTLEWVIWLLANICGGYGTNICGNKTIAKFTEFTYPSEFTEFTYPPPFEGDNYQVENPTINNDRNDYDKPKKVD